ncbi:MarR family transcriptional regulator [Actinoplanes cyaneus]|uniref:MarR family transcriptional regulator n=1 Tax=Actinoplanes cyaneus TaxID=52696 RepID=A0A919M918_9ACTN|nr:MarR family transcriptional regulator [Actinoplanes cyaneus]MCW2141008.1 DNA-binding transcriptional regulator, MarR family [Actinoplanes cyaneus]GID67069.1 MarR family transcriptional regulator [Actinoplanes cyaneus]
MTSRRHHQPSDLALAVREMLQANSEATHSLADRLGVGVTDAVALDHLLSSENGLGPTELGQRLRIRSASATTLVDRLHASGHAERVPHPSDRRRQTVVATDSAYEQVLVALKPLLDRIEQAAARLSPDQAEVTGAFLREVTAAMHDYATGPQAGARPGPQA